jgi:hypothetical protein
LHEDLGSSTLASETAGAQEQRSAAALFGAVLDRAIIGLGVTTKGVLQEESQGRNVPAAIVEIVDGRPTNSPDPRPKARR